MKTLPNIQNKAMLVRLNLSQWTARKYDKKVSDTAADDYKASKDAGRYNKRLVAQKAIGAIEAVAAEARHWHYDNTLPWQDDGQRILPAAHYLTYVQKMAGFKEKFNKAVAEFCKSYPALVLEAQTRLGNMYNHADYPAPSYVSHRFGFDVMISPIPAGNDFRVDLSAGEIRKIQTDVENRVKETVNSAMKDLWQRVYDIVKKTADKLQDSEGKFKDSLIRNLTDMTALLPKLNVTDDPELTKICREIEAKLCTADPDTLRGDLEVRKQVADEAQGILDAMKGYIG